MSILLKLDFWKKSAIQQSSSERASVVAGVCACVRRSMNGDVFRVVSNTPSIKVWFIATSEPRINKATLAE